jgi:hypothetical protein
MRVAIGYAETGATRTQRHLVGGYRCVALRARSVFEIIERRHRVGRGDCR